MRCIMCNANLTDYESTLRHGVTGEFLDTCKGCLRGLDIPLKERIDLMTDEEIEENFIGGLDKSENYDTIDYKDYEVSLEEHLKINK